MVDKVPSCSFAFGCFVPKVMVDGPVEEALRSVGVSTRCRVGGCHGRVVS
jgi:hypothetical protein